MYLNVVQHRLLDSIISSLERRGIDTADIKQRGTTILNNGVMVTGGTIQAQSLAVGKGAKAVVGSLKDRMTAPIGSKAD